MPAAKPGVVEPPELRPLRELEAGLKQELAAIKPITTVPVMEELPAGKRRVTKLHNRGNWNSLGPEVAEGVPTVFNPASPSANDRLDRLALAKWLVDPANPLTARVVVNRIWEQLFGIGIVSTSEEFGAQGDLPSHPELLDWLACELVEQGWNTKAITRLIVSSAAYRQTSKCPPELVAADPDNRLIACGPRVRLPAEVICTLRRPRSNTPLQALVTLNDPVYVEAAQALARRMIREGGSTAAERAIHGFRLVLARMPTDPEIDRLVRLHDEVSVEYHGDGAAARKIATDPLGAPPADLGIDTPEKMANLAAWTVVANVILNLDETFMCP